MENKVRIDKVFKSDHVKIDRTLRFDYDDLIKKVDLDNSFTLGDVLFVCEKSKIPMETLQKLVRCHYVKQYCKEVKKRADKNSEIDYLEIYWGGNIDDMSGQVECNSQWIFHGLGKKGVVSDDYTNAMSPEEKGNYREKYAVEFSPMYKLAHLPIKVLDRMIIVNELKPPTSKGSVKTIEFAPPITLIELLHAIFWELSFYGSPEERNTKIKELMRRCKEIDKIKEKTSDQHTLSLEEVKAKFKKKFKEKNNGL